MPSIVLSYVAFILGPLPPSMVRLSNKGHTDKLSAAWQPTGGDQDGYVLTLYYAGSGTVVAKKSIEKDATNFTFSGLMPGTKYLLEVASMAGPCRIPAGNISDWTCEYDRLHSLLCMLPSYRFSVVCL